MLRFCFKYSLLVLIFISQSCVMTGNDLKVNDKSVNPNAIKGAVSFFNFTLGFSSAHAAVPQVCSSQKSTGSELYAELRGIAPDGTKVLICDVDIVSSNYEFNVLVSNLDALYPAIQIDIIDTRSTATLANRKIITSSSGKTININPDASLTAHAIEKAGFDQVFSGGDFATIRTQLDQKKSLFTPERLALVLPDVFSGTSISGNKLENLVMFFGHGTVDSTVLASIGTKLGESTPSSITTPVGMDLCAVNLKSSIDCFKSIIDPESACFINDYAINYLEYETPLITNRSLDVTPLTTTNSCDGSKLKQIALLHLDQDNYYDGSSCNADFQSFSQDCSSIPTLSSFSSPKCQWEVEFFCYVHGNFLSEAFSGGPDCTDFNPMICVSNPSDPRCIPAPTGCLE